MISAGKGKYRLILFFIMIASVVALVNPAETYSRQKKAKTALTKKTKNAKSADNSKSKSKKKSKEDSKTNKSNNANKSANPRDELNRLNQSIEKTKNQIQDLSNKEKSTVSKLYQTQKQSEKIARYINILDYQINTLQKDINNLQLFHASLKDKLNKLQIDFALLARKVYLEGNLNDAEMLYFQKPYKNEISRDIYVRRLSIMMDETAKRISMLKDSIGRQANILQEKNEQQSFLKTIKLKEHVNLKTSISKNQEQLDKIRNNKSLLIKELAQKESSAKKLRNIIADLVRREEAKAAKKAKEQQQKTSKGKQTEKSAKKGGKEIEEPHEITAKANPTGKYTWPTSSRKILRGYGQNKNQQTNTFYDNPGIDISTRRGSTVKAVASGTVSLIHWLPGYASLVIINHGNGTRSVYANLQSVAVQKNQSISAGQIVGSSGEAVDGEFLHFELWQSNHRLNPMSWLR